jgi:hypothetical protein
VPQDALARDDSARASGDGSAQTSVDASCSSGPTLATPPAGWVPYPGFDSTCHFYVPASAAQLPPPIQWEPCNGVVPTGIACRQMKYDWQPYPGVGHIDGGSSAWLRPDGTVVIELSRWVGCTTVYRMVADADGPVHSAIAEVGLSPSDCTLGSERSLNEGNVIYSGSTETVPFYPSMLPPACRPWSRASARRRRFLALDDAHIYIATDVVNIEAPGPIPIGLFRVARDGSTTDTLANGGVGGIVADATGAYWGTQGSAIFALLRGATAPITLGAKGGGVVAVDETYVYFWAYTGNLSGAGRRAIAVSRMPKAGGAPEPLYTSDDVGKIAVDATHMYVVKATGIEPTGQVVQLPKGGGIPTLVADKLADPADMVIDDRSVYVVDFYAGAIVRVPKP